MPQFRFGSHRERQQAEQALAAIRIFSPQDALRHIKKHGRILDETHLGHITTVFGHEPDIQKALARSRES